MRPSLRHQLPASLAVLTASVAGIYVCFSAGGTSAGFLALVAAGFAAALWLATVSGVVDGSTLGQAANT
jgi:hypothetical protein